jgi:hypothetical protein
VAAKNKTEKNPPDEKQKETTVEFLASLAAVLVTGLFIITFIIIVATPVGMFLWMRKRKWM